MAISGSEATTNSCINSMNVEGSCNNMNVTTAGRRRRRPTDSSSAYWLLVDYRSKQANLSANSLLRLETLTERGSTSKRKKDNLDQLQLEAGDEFVSFEDDNGSSSSIDESSTPTLRSNQSTARAPLSPPKTPSNSLSRASSHSHQSDPLTGDSEHSMNLEKVFEDQHKAKPKSQQELSCITVTISNDEKILFSLRNPEKQGQLHPPQASSDQDDPNSPPPPPSTMTRREIKCVIPDDRFQLPQMQIFRHQQAEPRVSNATTATACSTAAVGLQCIDEAHDEDASGYIENAATSAQLAASLTSIVSSCDSFAGDSCTTDGSTSLGLASEERRELKQRFMTVDEEDDEEETEVGEQSQGQLLQSEAEEEASDKGHDEENQASYSVENLLGLLSEVESITHADVSQAEETEGEENDYGVDESFTEYGYDDETEIGDDHTEMGEDDHTELGEDHTEHDVAYESETDRGYYHDGDNTETTFDNDFAVPVNSPGLLLGAVEDQSEYAIEGEYSEAMPEDEDYSVVHSADEDEEEEEPVRVTMMTSQTHHHCNQKSDAESARGGAEQLEQEETDGEESLLANDTDESSQHNAMSYGLSVYLSTHSRKANPMHGGKKKRNVPKDFNDSQTATSATASMTTGSMDASNQSSVLTSGTNRTGLTNNTRNTVSSRGSLRSTLTTGTCKSAPEALILQDSVSSMGSTKSELDESGHNSIYLEDLSRQTRASSAPLENSYASSRRRGGRRRPGSNTSTLLGDSLASASSRSSLFSAADSEIEVDDTTVGSAVDHRRRRQRGPRRHANGNSHSDLLLNHSSFQNRKRSRSSRVPVRGNGLQATRSAIIPRSNTPQGDLLRRSRLGDSMSSSRASISASKRSAGDSRPKLPPRRGSMTHGDHSHSNRDDSSAAETSSNRRRMPGRSVSMMGTSSSGNGRDRSRALPGRRGSCTSSSGNGRDRSRAFPGRRGSFLGGSRIKKWDSSSANQNRGTGLSLLERHLHKGTTKAMKQKTGRRASMASAADSSLPSLAQLLASN